MTEVSKDFMLAEYDYHLEEYRRSEQLGETRLDLFLTIATAVLGGSGLIAVYVTNDSWTQEKWLILFLAYLATLLFGCLTLLRIIHRNIESTKSLQALNRVRRYFVNVDSSLQYFLQYIPNDDQPPRNWKWRNGGLAQNVVLANALLASIAAYILAEIINPDLTIWYGYLIAVVVFFVVSCWQVHYVKRQYQVSMEKAIKDRANKDSKYPDPYKIK